MRIFYMLHDRIIWGVCENFVKNYENWQMSTKFLKAFWIYVRFSVLHKELCFSTGRVLCMLYILPQLSDLLAAV